MRRRHRHHGFERVAALGQDGAAGFGRRRMRRRDDAAAMSGGVEVDHAAALSARKPRFFSSASAVGSRPRNAT